MYYILSNTVMFMHLLKWLCDFCSFFTVISVTLVSFQMSNQSLFKREGKHDGGGEEGKKTRDRDSPASLSACLSVYQEMENCSVVGGRGSHGKAGPRPIPETVLLVSLVTCNFSCNECSSVVGNLHVLISFYSMCIYWMHNNSQVLCQIHDFCPRDVSPKVG